MILDIFDIRGFSFFGEKTCVPSRMVQYHTANPMKKTTISTPITIPMIAPVSRPEDASVILASPLTQMLVDFSYLFMYNTKTTEDPNL